VRGQLRMRRRGDNRRANLITAINEVADFERDRETRAWSSQPLAAGHGPPTSGGQDSDCDFEGPVGRHVSS